ncbi:PREDICTED: uncharacterized protein CFAP54, partial [Leptosomus discolor]|uniref:uncharacterized protein CFAP54 n=1 Tax=Leptosomus discolor TaxID=188344 RepID=UPI00052247A8
ANTLFNIWIKYKPRLPEWYYNEKLLKAGDSLAQIKEYKLALLQCYGRYLQQFVSVNLDDITDDVHRFKSIFFPNGFRDKNAALTVFARRGLIKVDELKQLENTSSLLENSETKKIFREATLKMSVMIFKRAVYESRRKPKSYLRPKIRVSLKEAQHLPWPRTTTERLLSEMFDGVAAQFLAILEALSDSSRHVLRPAPPVPDEIEIRDVISELLFAGLEILSGGVSSTDIQRSHCTDRFGIINASSTLLQLILTGENGVSGDAAVKFVKLAFSYEEWDVFDSAIEFVVNFLQSQDDPTWKKAEMELKLLTLMQPLLFPRKFKHSFSISENIAKEAKMPHDSEKKQTFRKGSLKHGEPSDDLIILATTVFSCVSMSKQNIQPDKEILVDVIMFLWQKCKTGLQRIQMSGSDYIKYIHKCKAYQWVHILWIINEVIQKSSIADTNGVMLAEITLRLSAILENAADSTRKSKKKAGRSASVSQDETCDMPEILMKSPTEQLQVAYESLEKAIIGMNTSRLMALLPDGKSIFDNCCTKVDPNDQNLNSLFGYGNDKTGTGNGFVMDLHLELIQAQHRVAVKLLKMTQGAQKDERSLKSSKSHVKKIKDFHYLTDVRYKAYSICDPTPYDCAHSLIKEALTLIEQVETEQSALYHSLKEAMSSKKKSRIPPPPLLLSRSHCSMTFKPAPFSSDIQVSWYTILGSVAGGSNMKVRLNNNKLPNTGEEIPADGKSLLEIHGLDPNEKYIFAVAAYSSAGKLIGDAIGETTKPILAYPPLSTTTVRAYLTQVAYQTGNYTLARESFSPMWDYFVSNSSPLPASAAVTSASRNLTISENRLHFEAVSQTSPITLHLFLRNIFAVCDINVMEGALFCDSICSREILYKEQVARLAECERMTVAIELSNWLNDANYTLQSVVQCYGLLAPIIYHKISSVPVVQILIKCLAVLQEIPSATLQKRQTGCYESIQHMIACTSFYTAKIILEEILLERRYEKEGKKERKPAEFKTPSEKGIACALPVPKDNPLTMEGVEHYGHDDDDFNIICLSEGTTTFSVSMSMETSSLKKPNASTLKKPRKEALSPIRKRQTLRQYLVKHSNIVKSPEAQRKCKEELRKVARHTLVVLLKPVVSTYLNRKKFHQMCLEEMPWRSQMNIYLAVAHYNLFKKKLEEQYNIGICGSQHLDSYNILDPEIFSLSNSGTVLVREAVENNTRTPTPPLHKKSGITEKQTCTDKSSEHSIKLSGIDTPQTQTKNDTEISISHSPKEYNEFLSNTILSEHCTKIFLHLRRAVVLAHRGGHWTLLQNACRELWNYTQELQLIANHSHFHMDTFPITRNFLTSTIWFTFYLASDMSIDMITELQASKSLKIMDPEGDFCIPSCLGGIMDENGGSNLHPQSPLDDVNVVDLKSICNLILKTIELLYQMKKWEALVHIAVQFNIFTQAAFKYWCQALDETLNIADALNNWQELGFQKNATDFFAVGRSTDISQKFLSQAGVWGCLHAAVLVAKIAQYTTPSKMRVRTKYCWFSAILFKTLFRASLPHPTSDCDFAQYEANMLIPGIDLFSDRWRADISTVVASLNFLMFELHCAKQNLVILPLFTLYQYIVSEICKDPAKCIEGRIFKIKVLTDIGFFTEAFHELSLLYCGERIPWKIPAGYRKIEQMKASQKFDSSKSLLSVTNLQVLEGIFNWSLSLTMVPLCNQQTMNKLTLAKMHFIICLSATINNLPEKVEKHIYSVDNNSLKEPSRITASNVKVDADKNPRQQEQRGIVVQLVDCKDELNMAMLKFHITKKPKTEDWHILLSEGSFTLEVSTFGHCYKQSNVQNTSGEMEDGFVWELGILLTEAEETLSHLVQNIQDKYDGEISGCSAEDLEALTEAKLQLAAISQQRHQAAFSVALAFSAIRLLQDAKIFRTEATHLQEEKGEREHSDSCIGDVRLPHSITAQEHMNVHLWLKCRTVLATALVTQIHGAADMKENDVAERRSVIKEVILEAEAFDDIETQAEMMVQAAILDLQEKCPITGIKLLLQIFVCGEPIEQQIEDSTLTCLVLPTKNIYLPHINLLAQVKMRIGHALAEKVACTPARGDPLQWLHALKHLESALKLCRASATKKLDMEAELLFQIGKVERQITEAGNNKSSQAVETLLEAIKLSQQHDQKFELIRRSYLEIALLYLHFATNNENVSQKDKMVPSKTNTCSGDLSSAEEALKSECYKVQAWIAVRAATQTSLEITGITSKISCVRTASPVSVVAEAERPLESRAANASNKEIHIQWYIPSLAKSSNDTETKVLLLYAYNTEPVKISNIKIFSAKSMFSGHLWIPLA